ncbi:MAG: SDR family NAD(P)-dependent oxidoreductase, partial [Alistipes sp.]|nr:SDR family NAD(P)-dependent oxidoreductase [Alistipes sp.]
MNEVNTNTPARYALVTGASRGIGRAIALKLASQGFVVIINYASNVAAAEKTLEDITANGGKAELLPFDVSNCAAVAAALAEWKANHPSDYISVVVNN